MIQLVEVFFVDKIGDQDNEKDEQDAGNPSDFAED
jgi:hypothetical protein